MRGSERRPVWICPIHRGHLRGCSVPHDEGELLLHNSHGGHVWKGASSEEPVLRQRERPWRSSNL